MKTCEVCGQPYHLGACDACRKIEGKAAADERQDAGWPGDGSGADDLADYNQNEANDYRDE